VGYIAAFDIGTTNAKGVLVRHDGMMSHEQNVPLHTLHREGTVEQDPEQWLDAIRTIADAWWTAGVPSDEVELLSFSGQMQDCIPIRANGQPVRPAILYSDGRGFAQAERVKQELGSEHIFEVTGNAMDGTLTFPKILWMKQHEPELEAQTAWFLISSKDYIVFHLTGVAVSDPTSAATAGMMNLRTRQWETSWLDRYGVEVTKLPPLLATDEIAGTVHAEAARITGFAVGTPVLCGIGDAGATTIGAGVTGDGEMYGYLGTTGWVGMTASEKLPAENHVFHLAHPASELIIAVAPLLNAGNAHQWAVTTFGDMGLKDGAPTNETYQAFEEALSNEDRSQNHVLFLPYLNGERTPVQDQAATGCFIGLQQTTTKAMMGCAVLEGVAFAMKQVQQLLVKPSGDDKPLIFIGGGSKSAVWCQMLADIFGVEVRVPEESQFLPALGAAAAGFIRLGWVQSYSEFADRYILSFSSKKYLPNSSLYMHYQKKYERYVNIYPSVKHLFT
jgi:xylulokinase